MIYLIKNYSLYFFLICFSLIPLHFLGQQGPGGVGNTDGTSNLILWTNPDDFLETDGASFATWGDLSGYSSDLTQPDATLRPIVKNNIVNGYDVVRFEAANRRLGKTSFTNFPTTAISGFYVNNTSDTSDGVLSYASTASNNNFLIFRSGNLRMYRNSPRTFSLAANNNMWNIVGFGWTSAGGNSRMSLNGTNGSSVSANQNGNPILAGGDLALAGEQDGSSSPYSFDTGQAHQGDFSEVIIFNTYINEAERIIVSNYLSAKYNIVINTNNLYTQDNLGAGDFDFNVAGIMQASDGSNHTDSQGTGIIRFSNPSDLDDDEYLFWGENVRDSDYSFSSDVSTGYIERINTKWRASATNGIGSVTVRINASDLNYIPNPAAGCNQLELVVDDNDDFSSPLDTYPLTLSGGVYTANLVRVRNNNYFTLQYKDLIVVDDTQFYNGSGTFNVPNVADDCFKLLVKNTSTGSLTLSENADVREIEIESGGVLSTDPNILLTVENEIVNNGEIRLVGDSQLVQRHTSALNLNSGTGNLFVDQTASTSTVFQSGYWSSPVSVTGVANGPYAINDVLKDGSVATSEVSMAGQAIDINFSPDFDGATSPVKISTRWLAKFNNAADWTRFVSPLDAIFTPGEGWNMKSVGVNFTFKGIPNDGNYTFSIDQDKFSLLGNPYPSALDADAFITDNASQFNGILYIYDGTSDNTHIRGDYTGTYNTIISGVSVGAGRYLPVGQAFFITKETAGTGTVTFRNSQRTLLDLSNTSSIVAKTTLKQKSSDLAVLKLNFDFSLANAQKRSRKVAIAFRGLTQNYEMGFDAEMWGLQPTDLYLKVKDIEKPFIITGIESFDTSLEIPLVVQTDLKREVTFSIDEKTNLESPIYLLDKITNTSYSLEEGSATLNLPKGEYINRFFITFEEKTLSTTEEEEEDKSFAIFYKNLANEIVIKSLEGQIIEKISLHTITGQRILEVSEKIKLKKDIVAIKTLKFTAGMYILKIKTEKSTIAKKVFIGN